ncbi:hypothetical protein [Microbulbifer sp.]|uniref:hypothetical protein n=1 Tax=Microbulbifer sp. TaxID=1908541 RepID=UPI003F30551C
MKRLIAFVAASLVLSGCSTSTYLKLPEDSVLKIKRGTEEPIVEGKVTRAPLSWSSAGGIPYKIEQNGEVVQEGRLRSSFRPASLFWPPAGAIYWPMGFAYPCYDLTKKDDQKCSAETLQALKSKDQ